MNEFLRIRVLYWDISFLLTFWHKVLLSSHNHIYLARNLLLSEPLICFLSLPRNQRRGEKNIFQLWNFVQWSTQNGKARFPQGYRKPLQTKFGLFLQTSLTYTNIFQAWKPAMASMEPTVSLVASDTVLAFLSRPHPNPLAAVPILKPNVLLGAGPKRD